MSRNKWNQGQEIKRDIFGRKIMSVGTGSRGSVQEFFRPGTSKKSGHVTHHNDGSVHRHGDNARFGKSNSWSNRPGRCPTCDAVLIKCKGCGKYHHP